MNAMMKPVIFGVEEQADEWLASWARWTRGDRGATGYPRRAVTERANEGGIMAGSPRPPTDLPAEEALTDKAVANLDQRHRSVLRRVIELHYERCLPLEGIAVALQCTRNNARATLGRAKRAIYRIRSAL